MKQSDITHIVIHCSASPQGRGDGAEQIHQWHQEKLWDGIGYHWVINEDGRREAGRPEYWQGAHASGYNDQSIGICLMGDGNYPQDQMDELFELLYYDMKIRYPDAEVVGHSDLDPANKPNCPGFDVAAWYQAQMEDIEFGQFGA